MSNEIISAVITGSATFLSTGVLGVAAVLISDRITKIKETNRKLIEDWEFHYNIEEALIKEIQTLNGVPMQTTKNKVRDKIAEELGHKINYFPSNIQKFKK